MLTCTGLIMYQMVQSCVMAVNSPRDVLLDRAVSYVLAHGISGLTLRRLASEIGTSHRMLIHHFGSKEALWVAIVHAVEARQRIVLSELVPDPADPPRASIWRWWKHISSPKLWPTERLFYELYGRALQGRNAEFLDGIVESWVEPIAEANAARGVPIAVARAHARLGVAVTRGLLLDLLATGDVAGVDAAMNAIIDAYEALIRSAAGPGSAP